MAKSSYLHAIRRAAIKRGIVIPEVSGETTRSVFKESVTNLVIRPSLPDYIKQMLKDALENMKFTKVDIHIKGDLEPAGNYQIPMH